MSEAGEGAENEPVWRRADGRPLTELDLRVYARAGLTPAEALVWANAGFEPYATERLRDAGVDLTLATQLREHGLSARHLSLVREFGDSLEAVAALAELGRRLGLAWALLERARRLDLSHEEITTIAATGAAEEVLNLLDAGVALPTVLHWHEAGMELRACGTALAEGATAEDMETTLRWHRAFPNPMVARAWQSTGLHPDAATGLAGQGYRPLDVLEGRVERAEPPGEGPRVRLDATAPGPPTAGGSPLHPVVLEALESGSIAETLLAFGYVVEQVTPRSRFLAAHAADLLIRIEQTANVREDAAVEVRDGAALLHVLPTNGAEPDTTRYSDAAHALSGLAARLEGDDREVVTISSSSLPAATLLQVAQPLARATATAATLNGLDVHPARFGDAWWLLPDAPQRWPGAVPGPDGSSWAIGELVLLETTRPTPVGFFADRNEGWSAVRQLLPLLLVERTDRAGHTSTTRLIQGEAGLEVLDDQGRGHPLGTDDLVVAITETPSLRDIRANEATAFLTTTKGLDAAELVHLLQIRQPELLGKEAPVDFPADYGDDARFASTTVTGLSQRRILVNGTRWLAMMACPDSPACLLPQDESDDDNLHPSFQEEWASFRFSREDPPYLLGQIGLVDDDLVGELVLDERGQEPGSFEVRRPGRTPRAHQIASWLAKSFASAECSSLVLLLAEFSILHGLELSFPNSIDGFDVTYPASLEVGVTGDTDAVLRALRKEREKMARRE